MTKYGDTGKAAMPLGLSACIGWATLTVCAPGRGWVGGGGGGVYIINFRIKRMQEYLLRYVLEQE
jgi:hypothetical protein